MTGFLRLFDTLLRCVNTCNNVYYMYKTEWTLEGSSNCCLNFALHYNSNKWIGILPMVFWLPPIHGICPPIHGNLTPLTMEYRPHYTCYFDPLPMVFRPPYPWNIDPLPMIYWPPYPWYIDPPIHVILTPYRWYIDPPTHGILTPPPIHGISTPLPMEYRPPYT